MLTAEFFKNNRNALRTNVHNQLVVVTASGLLQRSADTTFPFRQDSNFFYLTGINEPDIILVMCEHEEFLILPKYSEAEEIFGGVINCDEIAKKSGITAIYKYNEGWKKYKLLQQNRNEIHTVGQAPAKISGADSFYSNPARKYLLEKLKRINNKATLTDLRPVLTKMRQVKQVEEVEVIKRSIEITKQGFLIVKKIAKQGVYEYELEAEFDKVFKKYQSVHGYQPIIAGGKQACVLHYIKNNQQLKNNQLYLLDIGAEYCNYSADITRTYSLTKNKRQQQIIDSAQSVQKQAINYLKAGITWKKYVEFVEECMGTELKKLDLIKDATRQNIRRYFPHGVSHSLGLDVHDVCDYKVIQENMVITVEPGIYIPEEGIGVRIEDDILITKKGAINLSADIPYF